MGAYSQNAFLIIVLGIISIGITAGSVLAVQTIAEDLTITSGGGENGNLTVQDGVVSIPNGKVLIGKDGTSQNPVIQAFGDGLTTFQVNADGGSAVFTMRAKGGQAGLQFNDDDAATDTSMRLRIPAADNRLDVVDQSSTPDKVMMTMEGGTGFIGINNTNPTAALDINGDMHFSGASVKITSDGDICIGNC